MWVNTSACATHAQQGDLLHLANTIDALQAEVDANQRRLRELDDRVALLQDRLLAGDVENAAKATHAAPATPVVARFIPPAPVSKIEQINPDDELIEIRMDSNGNLISSSNKSKGRTVNASTHSSNDALFRRALKAMAEGKPAEAAPLFQDYVQHSNDGADLSGALYWLGECHFELNRLRDAIANFDKLLQRYPESNKAPDALLRIGLAHEKLSEHALASQAYGLLLASYPDSPMAEIARQKQRKGAVKEKQP